MEPVLVVNQRGPCISHNIERAGDQDEIVVRGGLSDRPDRLFDRTRGVHGSMEGLYRGREDRDIHRPRVLRPRNHHMVSERNELGHDPPVVFVRENADDEDELSIRGLHRGDRPGEHAGRGGVMRPVQVDIRPLGYPLHPALPERPPQPLPQSGFIYGKTGVSQTFNRSQGKSGVVYLVPAEHLYPKGRECPADPLIVENLRGARDDALRPEILWSPVERRPPPIPASITAISTPSSAKQAKAIAVVTSKNVGLDRSFPASGSISRQASRTFRARATTRSSVIWTLLILIRSVKWTR